MEDETAHLVDIYWSEIKDFNPLTREEESELFKRVKDGDALAIKQIIESNLRFVLKVARNYMNLGLPLGELICAGNTGLLEAVKRFDVTMGFKFISYAVWWIRQAILKSLNSSDFGRIIPKTRRDKIQEIQKLLNDLERTPTIKELAQLLGVTEAYVFDLVSDMKGTVSLDSEKFLSDGRDKRDLRDFIEDETIQSSEYDCDKAEMLSLIKSALSLLDGREFKIIRMYFGLEGEAATPLKEIGRVLGLTRERVRQLRERALGKIRAKYGKQFFDFYEV